MEELLPAVKAVVLVVGWQCCCAQPGFEEKSRDTVAISLVGGVILLLRQWKSFASGREKMLEAFGVLGGASGAGPFLTETPAVKVGPGFAERCTVVKTCD